MSTDLIRSTTAARILGVSAATVSKMKKDGKLSGPHGYVHLGRIEKILAKRNGSRTTKLAQELGLAKAKEENPVKEKEVKPKQNKKNPTSGGYFKPKRYKRGERDLMKSNRGSSGSAPRKNYHYIVIKP